MLTIPSHSIFCFPAGSSRIPPRSQLFIPILDSPIPVPQPSLRVPMRSRFQASRLLLTIPFIHHFGLWVPLTVFAVFAYMMVIRANHRHRRFLFHLLLLLWLLYLRMAQAILILVLPIFPSAGFAFVQLFPQHTPVEVVIVVLLLYPNSSILLDLLSCLSFLVPLKALTCFRLDVRSHVIKYNPAPCCYYFPNAK